jgi:hypothetical protein
MISKGRPLSRSFAVALILLAGLAAVSSAGPLDVYVGYADNLRPSPFFPAPWSGDPNTALFAGGGTFDAGAIMLVNNSGSNITIDDLSVVLNPSAGPVLFQIWGTPLAGGFVLPTGKQAIFTQMFSYNFDTSDYPVPGVAATVANSCSSGALASTAACIDNAPQVNFTLNGILSTFVDSGHVLNTGGFDFVNANPCPVAGDSPGNCNESLQWRLIGTTGIEDPGGNTPEPASYGLIGGGLVMIWAGRKRFAR